MNPGNSAGAWEGHLRLPGLVDLQVNGWGGIDFNAPALGPEEMESAAAGLLGNGIVAFLPTIVTNSVPAMIGALRAIAAPGVGLASRMIAGIHLEGPFISALEGPRGAHPPEHVRLPDLGLAEELHQASRAGIRILTLAPELPGAMELIEWCVQRGIIAAIGHSAADSSCIARAVDAGARLSTHLGNGCAQVLPRHPNHIWDQLADEALMATVIADGHHLPDSVLRVFARAKERGMILVSDVTAFGGMPPGTYETHIGGRVLVDPDGRVSIESSPGLLAGAALPLLRGVLNLAERGIVDFDTAWEMASTRPARVLGLGRPPGDVLFDPGSGIVIRTTLHDQISRSAG